MKVGMKVRENTDFSAHFCFKTIKQTLFFLVWFIRFVVKNVDIFGHLPTFVLKLTNFCVIFCEKYGFLPTFISKPGRLKALCHKGLRVFCPLSHFFLIFITIKSFIIYINKEKKAGF